MCVQRVCSAFELRREISTGKRKATVVSGIGLRRVGFFLFFGLKWDLRAGLFISAALVLASNEQKKGIR